MKNKRKPQMPARVDASFLADLNEKRKADGLPWETLCYWLFGMYIRGEIALKPVKRKA